MKPTRCNNHTLGNARCVRVYGHDGICSFAQPLHKEDSRDTELRALRAVRDAAEEYRGAVCLCRNELPPYSCDKDCARRVLGIALDAALRAAKEVTG